MPMRSSTSAMYRSLTGSSSESMALSFPAKLQVVPGPLDRIGQADGRADSTRRGIERGQLPQTPGCGGLPSSCGGLRSLCDGAEEVKLAVRAETEVGTSPAHADQRQLCPGGCIDPVDPLVVGAVGVDGLAVRRDHGLGLP